MKTPQLDDSYSGASKFCLVLRDIDASHAVNAGNYYLRSSCGRPDRGQPKVTHDISYSKIDTG